MSEKSKTIKHRRILYHVLTGLFVILALFLSLRFLLNHLYIKALEEENYTSKLEDALFYPNFPQSSIPHYNKGNAAYQRGDYEEAIREYQDALELFPMHPNECSIRINLALSILERIDFDALRQGKNVEAAVEHLNAARNVLVEEDCASDEENGWHSEDAEQLKEDIDRLLDQLNQPPPPSSGEGDSNQDSGSQSNNNQMDSQEANLQQELLDQMQDAMAEQNEAIEEYSNYIQDGTPSGSDTTPGDNW